ncbi:hypothetical protein [Corynebacterium accolens]|nr:hypothetical protein [Corynebacterium accolens]MDK8681503.1 hypothetical protein [Corynebacterium accolens]
MSTPAQLAARLRAEADDGSLESFCLDTGIDLLVFWQRARRYHQRE